MCHGVLVRDVEVLLPAVYVLCFFGPRHVHVSSARGEEMSRDIIWNIYHVWCAFSRLPRAHTRVIACTRVTVVCGDEDCAPCDGVHIRGGVVVTLFFVFVYSNAFCTCFCMQP